MYENKYRRMVRSVAVNFPRTILGVLILLQARFAKLGNMSEMPIRNVRNSVLYKVCCELQHLVIGHLSVLWSVASPIWAGFTCSFLTIYSKRGEKDYAINVEDKADLHILGKSGLVRHRTTGHKNKRMFPISVTWFIFNRQRR